MFIDKWRTGKQHSLSKNQCKCEQNKYKNRLNHAILEYSTCTRAEPILHVQKRSKLQTTKRNAYKTQFYVVI